MIPSLSQETITEYASEAQTIQEPTGTDYTQGVRVGKTVPAKWWNWLFSAVTKRVVQSRTDANNMLTELKNVVTDAGLTPSASDNTQLEKAITTKANTQINEYVLANKINFTHIWRQLAVIVNGEDITDQSYFDSLAIIKNGTDMLLYTTNITIGSISRGPAYSTDLEHWHLGYSNLSLATVCTNGFYYSLSGTIASTRLVVHSTEDLASSGTILYEQSDSIPYTGYIPFITIINNMVYMFTHRGELYKVNTDNTLIQLQVTTGLGQFAMPNAGSYNRAVVLEPVSIDGRIFVGNLEFVGGVLAPVFDASTDRPFSAVNISTVKRLHNGSILFAGRYSDSREVKILDEQGNVSEITNFAWGICTSSNDLVAKQVTGSTLQLSYDGVTYVDTNVQIGSINDRSIVQIQDKYFILLDSDYLFCMTGLSGIFENTGLPRATRGSIYKSLVDDKHLVYNLTDFDATYNESYLVDYDLNIIPFASQLTFTDNSVLSTYYVPPISATATQAIGQRYLSSTKYFITFNKINYVKGHTLYLQ